MASSMKTMNDFFTLNLSLGDTQLRAEMVKQVTKQTSMDRCVKCDGINVINQISEDTDNFDIDSFAVKKTNYVDQRNFEVVHICADCKKGWRLYINISGEEMLQLKLKSKDAIQSIANTMILLLCKARDQLELKVRQGRETIPVIEEAK